MNIYERRRLRLHDLVAERYAARGGRSALAERLARQPGYLSRCLNGGKRIGEAFARHIEVRLQLPAFWLDGASDAGQTLDASQLALLRGFAELAREQQEELMAALDATVRRNRAIYQHLARRGAPLAD